MAASSHHVAIALGSNLADRRAHLQFAIERLATFVDDVRVSSLIETEPVGVSEAQPLFLNGVVVGTTTQSPREVLARLLEIERERGRTRLTPLAARTLDLDLILYDDWQIDEPDLVVPHPRFRERAFVLGPLAEIAAEWIDPVTGKRSDELLKDVSRVIGSRSRK